MDVLGATMAVPFERRFAGDILLPDGEPDEDKEIDVGEEIRKYLEGIKSRMSQYMCYSASAN